MLLEIREINTYYDLSHILFNVSMEVHEGETVCLLGRNGVGKTTTFRSIMGLTHPQSGHIKFLGTEITSKPPFKIARLGVGFVPEDREIFSNLTVRENLEIAMKDSPKSRKSLNWTMEKVHRLFPVLETRSGQWAGTLSGGEQQMLTIARTLMGNPLLLLLDEPSEGLAPMVTQMIEDQIMELKKEGLTILLSEQNSSFALNVSDRVYILEKGHVLWQGSVLELKRRPDIMKTYLGV